MKTLVTHRDTLTKIADHKRVMNRESLPLKEEEEERKAQGL